MAFLKCRFSKNFIFTCSKYNKKALLNLPKLVTCRNELDDCFFSFFFKEKPSFTTLWRAFNWVFRLENIFFSTTKCITLFQWPLSLMYFKTSNKYFLIWTIFKNVLFQINVGGSTKTRIIEKENQITLFNGFY